MGRKILKKKNGYGCLLSRWDMKRRWFSSRSRLPEDFLSNIRGGECNFMLS